MFSYLWLKNKELKNLKKRTFLKMFNYCETKHWRVFGLIGVGYWKILKMQWTLVETKMLCQSYQISHYALNPKIMQNKAKILALKTKKQNPKTKTKTRLIMTKIIGFPLLVKIQRKLVLQPLMHQNQRKNRKKKRLKVIT